jgi:hypothetical protein
MIRNVPGTKIWVWQMDSFSHVQDYRSSGGYRPTTIMSDTLIEPMTGIPLVWLVAPTNVPLGLRTTALEIRPVLVFQISVATISFIFFSFCLCFNKLGVSRLFSCSGVSLVGELLDRSPARLSCDIQLDTVGSVGVLYYFLNGSCYFACLSRERLSDFDSHYICILYFSEPTIGVFAYN